jgi:hypothetical protein
MVDARSLRFSLLDDFPCFGNFFSPPFVRTYGTRSESFMKMIVIFFIEKSILGGEGNHQLMAQV